VEGGVWGPNRTTGGEGNSVATATSLGQAGLQGWREKVADGIADPVAKRAPLETEQVRALVGAAFFVLAVTYVIKTLTAAAHEARQG
jgi:hypothetical protein